MAVENGATKRQTNDPKVTETKPMKTPVITIAATSGYVSYNFVGNGVPVSAPGFPIDSPPPDLLKKRFDHASHLDVIRQDVRQRAIDTAVKKLQKVDFDTIAFSGVSGALIAPGVASRLNKEIIMVRKERDTDNHSGGRQVEGFLDAQKYIFLDDLISCGRTFNRVREKVLGFALDAKCVGYYTYVTPSFVPLTNLSNGGVEEPNGFRYGG